LETEVKRTYEGMFMVDSALAAQDWQKAIDEITRILNRAHAEILSIRKWDERRLCYDIRGKSRATYILAYFNCETDKLASIDRDIQLSELLMRALVLKADMIKKEDMEKPTPAEINPTHEEGRDIPGAVEEIVEDELPAEEIA
jgi:small subunit ribosomal protein S6